MYGVVVLGILHGVYVLEHDCVVSCPAGSGHETRTCVDVLTCECVDSYQF